MCVTKQTRLPGALGPFSRICSKLQSASLQREKTEQLCAPSSVQVAVGRLLRQTGPGPWQPLASKLQLFLTIATHSQPSCQKSPRRERHAKSPSMKREHSLRARGSRGVMLVTNLPLTSNTQSRVPLGAFFSESMLLGGMCTHIEARAHLEHSGGLTGICTAFAEPAAGSQAHASCSCQCHFACRRGWGHRDGRRCLGMGFG